MVSNKIMKSIRYLSTTTKSTSLPFNPAQRILRSQTIKLQQQQQQLLLQRTLQQQSSAPTRNLPENFTRHTSTMSLIHPNPPIPNTCTSQSSTHPTHPPSSSSQLLPPTSPPLSPHPPHIRAPNQHLAIRRRRPLYKSLYNNRLCTRLQRHHTPNKHIHRRRTTITHCTQRIPC
ncbi:hypothetical protein GMOD_00006026 [Pyrenophora seminiperda CCB06]|uniref:Uncharacterized protein n=1 Tax=Pyrenophora seminiperda CCB06 TaxID=1302712 RepID=A0A3M7M4H8_9PLEO|nr:hypothetical protein GMOD_00006026 [Pyrenophora seminiperda CCB06]